jgi:hypothetical protein
MKQRFVTFDASFPDDARHSETGDVISPGGRAIAERLVSLLGSAAPCEQHSHYGWAFAAGGCWCLVQHPDSWLLIVEDRGPLFERWFRPNRAAQRFQAFSEQLSQALDSDRAFSNVSWFTREEYERLGPRRGRD